MTVKNSWTLRKRSSRLAQSRIARDRDCWRARSCRISYLISLAYGPPPIHDGELDEERGSPESARALQRQVAEDDGFLIASPEHNGGYKASLKNAADWINGSASTDESAVLLFSNKVAALISTSPGPISGVCSALAFRGVSERLR